MNVFAGLINPPVSRPGMVIPVPPARKLCSLPEVLNPWLLSPSQVEMVRLTSEGLSNYAIAAKLGISVKTVEMHLRLAYRRMTEVEGREVSRVLAAVLFDRFTREKAA